MLAGFGMNVNYHEVVVVTNFQSDHLVVAFTIFQSDHVVVAFTEHKVQLIIQGS